MPAIKSMTGLSIKQSKVLPDRATQSASARAPRANVGGIVAILPRGEAIRNFVYSGALDAIAAEVPVTLLTVIPDEEFRQSALERYDSVRELRSAPERWPVRFLRQQLDLVHGRYLWSAAAQERWRRRDAESNTPAKRLKRAAQKMVAIPLAHRTGVELVSNLERAVSHRLSTSDDYARLYEELKPAMVFNCSHVHSANATQAVQAAQWMGIPTATFLFSWDNLTSQGRILLPYDYYLAWNEGIAEQLLDIYPKLHRQQVIVTGTPQFDFHFRPDFYWSREEFCARVGADPSRPLVLYSTGMDNHMPGEPLVIEGIARMLREMTDLGSPQLMVRLYPKDRQPHRFDEMRQRNPDILFPEIPWVKNHLTPKFEDVYLLTNTLRHVAAGINVASTVSLELCMLDKPVINVGYNPPGLDISPIDYRLYYNFDHYRPVVESGAVRLASSETEMRSLLRAALQNPDADRARRQAFLHQMFGNTLDGQVGARVANALLTLIR